MIAQFGAARLFIAAALVASGASMAVAQSHGHSHGHDHEQEQGAAPYAGLQDRKIAGLSSEDIAELRAGGGWGLALPAELNGYPGPRHVLDLADELALTEAQITAIEALFVEMREEAIAVGERMIAAEQALGAAFRAGEIDPERLRALVEEAGGARAELRYVHLSRHLATAQILEPAQIRRYDILRGYAEDPCAHVPEGHDPAMWRRHNDCG